MNLPNEHILQHGKYRLTHVVGQGGFGITYKGVWFTEVKGSLGTIKTEVPVCIKEYFFKDYCYRDANSFVVKVHSETGRVLFDKFKEKLIKEAKILSEVHHPHIVNVLEVFEENGTAYIAMEYIPGYSLKYSMDKEGVLSEKRALKFIHQIGEALQFVHEKNILHLDIKPSNILIDGGGKARLIDFGVSKRYDIEQQETSTTMLTLSKGFASIEQYDSEGTQSFSPCPDIYSLGATLYNLLTGKIPTESILRATKPLQKPTDINSSVTLKTEAVIIKAMQIIPADRFQSVREMLAALDIPDDEEEEIKENIPDGDIQEGEETTVLYTAGKQLDTGDDPDCTIINDRGIIPAPGKKKRKGVFISVLIAVLACVGSLIGFWVQGNRTVSAKIETIKATLEDTIPDTSLIVAVPVEKEQTTQAITEAKEPVMPEIVVADNTIPAATSVVKSKVSEEKKTTEQTIQPSVKDIDAEYSVLFASGKAKMDKADYTNAKKDFAKAKEVKLTEEVVKILIVCNAKEDEKHLSERKDEYEEKTTFGKYKIVRKKSTRKYGAIDSDALEMIPCKYVYVGIAKNGRAFEREDGLFDIYNVDGVLISKGSTYYD